jgi:acetyl esterase/lipase
MATSNRHPVLSYQPIKLLFQLTYFTTIIARFPFWLVSALFQSLRPHPKWNVKQTLMSKVAYCLVDLQSRIGVTQKLSLQQGKEGERFQIADPAVVDAYQGPLNSPTVKPSAVGGTWFPRPPGKNIASKTVVLYLHGGAYVQGNGRYENIGFAGETMIELGGVDAVFSLQYRLSGWAGLFPFPAALQDALTGYLFLLQKLSIPAKQIILCGDSAGGNLAIALLRYIQEFGSTSNPVIPPPRCATLLSPWVAPFDFDLDSSPRRISDYLPTSFLQWGAHTYTEGLANASSNSYVTPLGNPFATPVPIFVNAGSAEIFFDSNKSWVEEMKKISGNRVEFHEEDAAVHDTFLTANALGWEESARGVISEMGAFIGKF